MATRLTDLNVKNAKPGTYRDAMATGLILKVTSAGRKIWLMQSVWPGQVTASRRTMGKYPALSLDDARKLARDWYEASKAGSDPKQIEADRRRAAVRAQANTFAAVAESYIEGRTNRRAHKDALAIRRYLIKPWSSRPIASIMPHDVRELIGDLLKRSPFAASEAWNHASQIFKEAVDKGLIDASPSASLKKSRIIPRAKLGPRQRVLEDGELVTVWQAIGRLAYPEQHLYRWLLLTGCRRGEASGAVWSEFDLERGTWSIPPERFKMGKTHVLPLTEQMLALLKSLPRNGPWLFSYEGSGPMNGWSKLKEKIDKLTGPLPDWTNHDLRRTMRTHLSPLVPENIAEEVIGHGRTGIRAVYDRWRYLPEKKAALEAWHARLAAIVGDVPPSEAGLTKICALSY